MAHRLDIAALSAGRSTGRGAMSVSSAASMGMMIIITTASAGRTRAS